MTDIGDVIELVVDIPAQNLRAGMQGTVVHQHTSDAFEVEFVDEDGKTFALVALDKSQFVVIWSVATKTEVSVAERTASIVALLSDEAAYDVLDLDVF